MLDVHVHAKAMFWRVHVHVYKMHIIVATVSF